MLAAEEFSRPAGDPASIERAVAALKSAKQPFIFAGGGVASADAAQPLEQLAEALGAPVVTSVFARGVLSDRHRLALGDGWGRLDLYDDLLQRADLALIVGSRLDVVSDWNQGARFPKRIVQIDIDPLVIGQRRPVEVGIVGDAGAVLRALAAQLTEHDAARECWFDVPEFRRRKRERLTERVGPVLQIIDDLRAALPDDAIFVDDLTVVGYWMPLLSMRISRARSFIPAPTERWVIRCPPRSAPSLRSPTGPWCRSPAMADSCYAARAGDRARAKSRSDCPGVQRQRLRCHCHVSRPQLRRPAHRLEPQQPRYRQAGRRIRLCNRARRALTARSCAAARARGGRHVGDRSAVRSARAGVDSALDGLSASQKR